MNTWSEPVFAICHNIDGKNIPAYSVILDFRNFSGIERLADHNITVHGITNFFDSICATCDCAKLYGFFDGAEIAAWDKYFQIMFLQNPNIYDAQAHFYCDRYGIPFMISKRRTDTCVKVFKGQKYNILYNCIKLRINPTPKDMIEFDAEMYKNIVRFKNELLISTMEEEYGIFVAWNT